ncbi:MAG: hypothetical protein AB8W78_05970 [Arsenophonus endosymbiont of Dermacentor nuttalli]
MAVTKRILFCLYPLVLLTAGEFGVKVAFRAALLIFLYPTLALHLPI